VKKYLGSVVPTDRQLLCDAELGGVLRRLVRLHAQGRALPDGAVDLFPHQREEHRPVRAHADHRRRGRYVSYLEGCTAPMRDENQLHAAVVELVALTMPRSSIRPCRTGIRATRTARAASTTSSPSAATAAARTLQDFLDAGRDRLGDHLEISELHPARRQSRGEFYSIAISNGRQQVDSGTKMIHLGQEHVEPHHLQGHRRRPLAEHLSRPGLGASQGDKGARNFTQCDSLLIGDKCGAHTVPYIESQERHARVRARGDDLEDLRRPAVLLPQRG
jgi:Fe-S cluster assembly protein SufB